MLLRNSLKDSKGDTIVEVLIAMAITGLILGGAFVSASRSSQIAQTAQERGEALKIAESQIEQIRIAAVATPSPLPAPGTSFCFSNVTPPTIAYPPSSCKLGSTTSAGYDTAIMSPDGYGYTVQVTWDALVGGSKNMVELDYQIQ